jgi:Ankyrin repeats (3 copies)
VCYVFGELRDLSTIAVEYRSTILCAGSAQPNLRDALLGLERGDFSRLDPLFAPDASGDKPSQVVQWHDAGLFGDQAEALAEALTCACFLGRTEAAEYFLQRGVPPPGGAKTGLNALHWAANRGQLEVVRLLIRWKAPMETRSMYGGNVLDTTVWSAINEARPNHLVIIEELLEAGARLDTEVYPTGNEDIDVLLRRHPAV